ncbi:LPS-assembly protein LptD [Rickettsiales bacterium LUAb2]
MYNYKSLLIVILIMVNLVILNNYIYANQPDNKNTPLTAINNVDNFYTFADTSNQPIHFKAKNIEYNNKLGLVIATGNVEITQNTEIIKADKVYIQKDKNIILAKGNVYYKNKEGKQLFGNQIEIKNDFNNLIITRITMLFPDNSLLAAKQIVKNGEVSETYNASYTTCRFGKFVTPFWSIKANKITYDNDSKDLQIQNGWFEIKDTPILWIPYISYADPSKKRKAGFLFPTFGSITSLGSYSTVPLFLPLGDYTDLTINTTVFQFAEPMVDLSFSSFLPSGEITIQPSFTHNNNKNDWHIFSYYRQELNDKTRLTVSYNDTSSLSYLSLYPIKNYVSNNPFLKQNVSLEYFATSHDYLNISFTGTKAVDSNVDRFDNPYILPNINYSHLGKFTPLGKIDLTMQYSNFLTDNLSHFDNPINQTNSDNFDFNKLTTVISHEIFKPTDYGVFTLDSSIQNVNYYKYYLDNNQNSINGANNNNKNLFDSYTGGNIALKAEYPVTSMIGNYTNVFSPTAQLAYSDIIIKKRHDLSYLEQDDLTINSVNLFENNKYSGYDYYEQGSRFNYGLLWSLINPDGFNGKMLLGQSIYLNNNNDDAKSNYIAYLGVSPSPYVNVSYEGLLNPQTNKFEQSNLNFFLGNNLVGSNITYSSKRGLDPNIYDTTALEELTSRGYIQLSATTQINASATFDLKNQYSNDSNNQHLKQIDLQLMWQNDCISLIAEITRNYYQTIGEKPNTNYHFNIVLKSLGSIGNKSPSTGNDFNSI